MKAKLIYSIIYGKAPLRFVHVVPDIKVGHTGNPILFFLFSKSLQPKLYISTHNTLK